MTRAEDTDFGWELIATMQEAASIMRGEKEAARVHLPRRSGLGRPIPWSPARREPHRARSSRQAAGAPAQDQRGGKRAVDSARAAQHEADFRLHGRDPFYL